MSAVPVTGRIDPSWKHASVITVQGQKHQIPGGITALVDAVEHLSKTHHVTTWELEANAAQALLLQSEALRALAERGALTFVPVYDRTEQ